MRYLLDTHALLWFLGGDERLSQKARACIEGAAIERFVSIASLWEIAIKVSLKKLVFPTTDSLEILSILGRNDIQVLDLKPSHVMRVAGMPFFHRDPFDRLLIAQAALESMTLVSGDEKLSGYDVPVVW